MTGLPLLPSKPAEAAQSLEHILTINTGRGAGLSPTLSAVSYYTIACCQDLAVKFIGEHLLKMLQNPVPSPALKPQIKRYIK